MKDIRKWLLAIFCAINLIAFTGIAEAHYRHGKVYCRGYRCCKWVRGHWWHHRWRPAHRVCWHR